MSVHVLSRFLKESESELGARLVGSAMAFAAGEDGICWADQRRLMRETKLSESSVRRAIRELEKLGEVETRHAQRGRSRINVYRMWCAEAPDYDRLPFAVDRPFKVTTGQSDRRSNVYGTTGQIGPRPPVKSENTPLTERQENDKTQWSVGRKLVTASEEQLARAVLAAWNVRTGQVLASRDWLAMIVMRIREHPELELVDHERVIDSALANPWWQGAPSPNVVYGSGAQLERSLVASSHTQAAATSVEDERARFARILKR